MTEKSILVVEDEPLVGMELQEGLSRMGYHVPEVITSGDEVMRAVHRFHPDLVLMDIRINGSMDGIQATAKLRETSDVPVLFLTAYSDSATIKRAAEILPDGYLLKPFGERELQANIEMLLLKSQARMKEDKSLRKMIPILDALDTALVLFDRTGKAVHGNPAAQETFRPKDGATQLPDLALLLQISQEEFETDVDRWLSDKFPRFVDVRSNTWTVTLEALLGQEGRKIGFLAVFHSLDEQEQDHLQVSAVTVNRTLTSLLPENGQYAERLDSAGFLLPSPSGTGDVYDLFPIGPHHFVFYNLDVAGHGPLPAMVAYSLHAAIRDLSRNYLKRNDEVPSPSGLLETLNRKFLPQSDAIPFFTLTLGILAPITGEFQLVRAGHTRTLWARADGSFQWLHGKGTALGAFPEVVFEELSGRLRSRDRLILCSDGVLETLGDKNLDRGYAALEEVLRAHPGVDIETLVQAIQARCVAMENSRRDDMSLLAVGSKTW